MMQRAKGLLVYRALAVIFAAAPSVVMGQAGITVWAGAGGASQDGKVTFGKDAKQLGVQVGVPLLPIAVRADALLFGSDFDLDALSYTVNGVVQMRLPVITPYGILGRGRYAITESEKVNGWNFGAGVRVGLGRLGVFGELRRHDAISRTVTIVGLTF